MTLRFTAKSENTKSIVCLKHGQMSIKCFRTKLPFLELDYTASAK
jgi:hypothetical protein